MSETAIQELREAIAANATGIRIEEQTGRSVDWFQFLAWATSAGALGGLWTALEWFKVRHGSATIKVSYTSELGEVIDIEYSGLTKEQADEILAAHPPQVEKPTRVLIRDTANPPQR